MDIQPHIDSTAKSLRFWQFLIRHTTDQTPVEICLWLKEADDLAGGAPLKYGRMTSHPFGEPFKRPFGSSNRSQLTG